MELSGLQKAEQNRQKVDQLLINEQPMDYKKLTTLLQLLDYQMVWWVCTAHCADFISTAMDENRQNGEQLMNEQPIFVNLCLLGILNMY